MRCVHIYEANTPLEIGALKEKFRATLLRCQVGAPLSEVLLSLDSAVDALESLRPQLGTLLARSNVERHSRFARAALRNENREEAMGDLRDLAGPDMESLLKEAWLAHVGTYDDEFYDRVSRYYSSNDPVAAVRESFSLLSERLRTLVGEMGRSEDGHDLVNRAFGSKGKFRDQLSESDMQGIRNLLDGLYSVFRNKYSHRKVEPNWVETRAVVECVNWALFRLDGLSATIDPV